MEAEIISIGTEIVLGQIVNTNARFLADQLRRLDIDAHWQTLMMIQRGFRQPSVRHRHVLS
jgi:molybdopterin-biosynthesis enzyme MoeA-like protein